MISLKLVLHSRNLESISKTESERFGNACNRLYQAPCHLVVLIPLVGLLIVYLLDISPNPLTLPRTFGPVQLECHPTLSLYLSFSRTWRTLLICLAIDLCFLGLEIYTVRFICTSLAICSSSFRLRLACRARTRIRGVRIFGALAQEFVLKFDLCQPVLSVNSQGKKKIAPCRCRRCPKLQTSCCSCLRRCCSPKLLAILDIYHFCASRQEWPAQSPSKSSGILHTPSCETVIIMDTLHKSPFDVK